MPLSLANLFVRIKPDFFISIVHEANFIGYYSYKLFGKKTKYVMRLANVFEKKTLESFLFFLGRLF